MTSIHGLVILCGSLLLQMCEHSLLLRFLKHFMPVGSAQVVVILWGEQAARGGRKKKKEEIIPARFLIPTRGSVAIS